MRASMLCASLICLLWGTIANGAEENLAGLKAVQQGEYVDLGSKAGNEITLKRTRGGAIAFLAAPSGTHFEVPGIAVSAHEAIALAFVRQHAGVFGVESSKVAFKTKRITSNKRVYNVRLEQTIDGVPVYGGEMMIHVLDTGGVLSARIDILRDTSSFDSGKLVAIPILSAKEAEARAVDAVITTMVSEGYPVGILTAQDSEFVIFDSAVLMDVQAPPRPAWKVTVLDKESGDAAEEVIVDSETGSILHRAPLVSSAINRQINDAFGSILYMWGYPRRYEGDGPAVQPQVNLLYDFMGQVYEYYSNMHGRDGYDGAGCAIRATARHVSTKGCPNALYNTPLDRFGFCAGMVADDIVAHEYTHAVTHNTACLEGGFTESGAIDESLSDIWGEFVDLTYGTDDPNDMWKLFEDTINGVARDMAEPHNELQPDYYGGEFWHTDMEPHFNAGVGNKLCYLLAAGDTDFYGNNYAPLSSSLTTSMSATIKLYHEIQTNRLLSTSNYQDLGSALNDAAIDACLGLIDLGNDITWNAVALQKVINDVVAVGID